MATQRAMSALTILKAFDVIKDVAARPGAHAEVTANPWAAARS